MKPLISNYFFIDDLPEGVTIELVNLENTNKNWVRWYLPDFSNNGNYNLPPGNWQIIGWSDEIGEEQAAGIVEKEVFWGWPDFDMPSERMTGYLPTALESSHSLLRSKGIKTKVLILKKS